MTTEPHFHERDLFPLCILVVPRLRTEKVTADQLVVSDIDAVKTEYPSSRVAFLDGLRGMAALIVALQHYTAAFFPFLVRAHALPAQSEQIIFGMFDGRIAVFIFFVLSGFVLGQSSSRTKTNFISTVIARYLRLTIPMLICLILAWYWVTSFHDTRVQFLQLQDPAIGAGMYGDEHPSIVTAIRDGVYHVYTTGYSLFDGPVWTMRKELIGSIGVYILYLLVPVRLRWYGLAIFGLVTFLEAKFFMAFPLGILLREMWTRGWLRYTTWGWLLLLLSLLFAGILRSSPNATNTLAFVAAAIVLSVLILPASHSMLCRPFPQFLGRISFAFYLVHLPLLYSVMAWGYLHVNLPIWLWIISGLPVFLALSFSFAWVITACIDEPLVRFLHHLKKQKMGLLTGPPKQGHA